MAGCFVRAPMVGHACPTFRKASAQPDVRERNHDEVVHGDTGREEADIDRVGLSYMLMGDVRQGQGATLAQDPARSKNGSISARISWSCCRIQPRTRSRASIRNLSNTSPIQRSTVPGPIIATSSQQPHAATTDFLGLDMRLVLQQIQIRQLWKQQLRKQRQNLHECRQCR